VVVGAPHLLLELQTAGRKVRRNLSNKKAISGVLRQRKLTAIRSLSLLPHLKMLGSERLVYRHC